MKQVSPIIIDYPTVIPITISEDIYFKLSKKWYQIGWIYNLHNKYYTHYFDSYAESVDFIQFVKELLKKVGTKNEEERR